MDPQHVSSQDSADGGGRRSRLRASARPPMCEACVLCDCVSACFVACVRAVSRRVRWLATRVSRSVYQCARALTLGGSVCWERGRRGARWCWGRGPGGGSGSPAPREPICGLSRACCAHRSCPEVSLTRVDPLELGEGKGTASPDDGRPATFGRSRTRTHQHTGSNHVAHARGGGAPAPRARCGITPAYGAVDATEAQTVKQ